MDGPPRANAAQLAARKIKEKPKAKRSGSASIVGSSSPFAQQPQSSGGLFGGGVQAPGDFNFIGAPSAPSFPPSTFGGNNAFGGSASNVFGGSNGQTSDRESERLTDDRPAKRQFGVTPATQNGNTFQMPNGFGQNSSSTSNTLFPPSTPSQGGSNTFGSAANASQNQPNPFNFQPSQAPAASFGGGPSASKPASNVFNFTQPAQPPKSPAPATSIFNQPFTNSEANPPNPLFPFGTPEKPPSSSVSTTSGMNFGSTPASHSPAKDIFPTQPSTTAPSTNLFGSITPAPQTPAKELFPSVQPAATTPPTTIFGNSTPTVSKPQTSNMFGNLQPTKPSATSIFTNSTPATANGTKNPFASLQQQPQNNSNVFGNLNQTTTAVPSFGEPKSQPTSNVFASLPQPPSNEGQKPQAASSVFNTQSKTTEASSNIFGTPKPQVEPPKSLFPAPVQSEAESPNKPFAATPQSQTEDPSKIFTNAYKARLQAAQAEQPSNDLTSTNKPATATNAFTHPNKPLFQPFFPSKPFGSEPGRPVTSGTPSLPADLFSHLNKPLGQSAPEPKVNGIEKAADGAPASGTPFTSGVFGSLNKPQDHQNIRQEAPVQCQASPVRAASLSLGVPQKRLNWPMADWNNCKGYTMKPHTKPVSKMSPRDIPYFMEPERHLPLLPEVVSLMDSVSQQEIKENFKAYDVLAPKIPEKAPSMIRKDGNLVCDIRGDAKQFSKFYPGLAFAKTFPQEFMARLVPEHFSPELRVQFYALYRLKVLEHEMDKFRATLSTGDYTMPADMFKDTQRKHILQKATVEYAAELERLGKEPELTGTLDRNKLKRVATNNEDQENEPPTKSTKPLEVSDNAQQPNGDAAATTSGPKNPFQPLTNGSMVTTPSSPFSQPAAPQQSVSAPLSRGKRKGDDLNQDMPQPKRNSPLKALNGNGGGSSTSNLFKEIVDSPPKATSPMKPISERKTFGPPMKPAATDAPHFNPFGNLPVPPSPTATKAIPPSTANILSPQPSSPSKLPSSNVFAAATAAGTQNLFAPKASSDLSKSPSPNLFQSLSTPKATEQNPKPIKMPNFGASLASGMKQFAAQAAKDAQENEEKLLQKAIDEDYDSDDETKEEFKARWKVNRAAELKELKEIASKGNTFKLTASKDTAPTSPTKTEKTVLPTPFGQNASEDTSGGLFSVNGSRTSTPGLVSSPGSSVFDGHTSGKQAFAVDFFSKPSSEPDSAKEEEEEDDDDDSAGEDADGESDSENKDPNYQPGHDAPSGPGTPASETGEGIASAKKTTAFSNFGQTKPAGIFGTSSNSGSSTPVRSLADRMSRDSNGELIRASPVAEQETTPVRSLEDRMSKDSNGNLIRQIPSEEKENAQPSTTSVFANLKNPFSSPKPASPAADKTWKQDSPIKFGSSASDVPAFSVTAATPSKAPSVLFGNLKDSSVSSANGSIPPPFSNLLGNGINSKPSISFAFGASSTSSSLFPSAAVSTSTSRATTPGGTTDGESGVDNDPDVERHEQLDLTSGGPGEEDEEIMHEIRAKGNQYVKRDDDSSPWVVKGLGILRVLKNKDTKNIRIILRSDPSGKVILNKGLLPNMKYEPSGKTVKVMTLGDDGKGLETWILQVKTEEAAKALADTLESNKASNI